MLCMFLICTTYMTCPTNLILFYWNYLYIIDGKYEASQYAVFSLFFNILFSDPDILLYFLLKHT